MFLIDLDLAQAIYSYLVNRPYIEVSDFVDGLRHLQPVMQQTAADEKPPNKEIQQE